MKFAVINGKRVDLIPAESSDFFGTTEVYFNEIFITKKWKQKGLAKNIQRKFIETFCHQFEFIWGTIDSANILSYKTAYSNGRRPVRLECFINL